MADALLFQFSSWLGTIGLTGLIAETFWVVPALQTLHILSVAVVLAGSLFMNLRILGVLDRGQHLETVIRRFLTPVLLAVLVLAITGALLVAAEPTRALFRTLFWIKMLMVLTAVSLTWVHRPPRRYAGNSIVIVRPVSLGRKVAALISVLLWFAIIAAGRWIAYVEAWPGAPA